MKDMPSFSRRVKNFSNTMAKTIKATLKGEKTVDWNSSEKLAICLHCDELDKKGWCRECGCYVRLKIHLSQTHCDKGKW